MQPPPSPIPSWVDPGSILVLVGAVLTLIGFLLFVALIESTNFSNFEALQEYGYGLIGVGLFVSALGWFIHQRYLYQRLTR